MNDIRIDPNFELVTINSFDDIRKCPAYREDIDIKQHKISKLIGDYTFKEQVHCGLKNCHTPHNTGFLAVTEDGLETNIGHVCGNKWSGDNFAIQKRQFKQIKEYQQHSQLLNATIANKTSISARIKEISERKYGAKWLQNSISNFRDICPSDIYKELIRRASRNELNVILARERTSDEIATLQAMNPNAPRDSLRYEEKVIGLLSGLEIFKTSIHDLLIVQVANKLTELSQKQISLLKISERRKFVEWANQIENHFTEAEELLASCLRFFHEDNLKYLPHLTKDTNNQLQIRRLKWNLDKSTGNY